MNGTNQSQVKVTLRNPLDYSDLLTYIIIPDDSLIAKDWVSALKQLLASGNLLEKNYCFMGFPHTARNLDYLCNELNKNIQQINLFNRTNQWQRAGLEPYVIEEYFTPDVVRWGTEYPVGYDERYLGLSLKHGVMNRLHNHFERLQGTVWNLSEYYKVADYETKYAIRQLNNLCHEIENLVLSQRKLATLPQWVRPSQITTFLHAARYDLKDEHRQGFATNGYDRKFGHVYMHWTQIGKTLFEVWRDEGAPKLTVGEDPTDISIGAGSTCEAINSLKFYSGEFDVEWANDVVLGGPFPWHNKEQAEFKQWLEENGLDATDPNLSLGYLPLGHVDLLSSFGTEDSKEIWEILGRHLDIYSIEVDGVVGTFNYCWNDPDYKDNQIEMMKPGYDYSSRRR